MIMMIMNSLFKSKKKEKVLYFILYYSTSWGH